MFQSLSKTQFPPSKKPMMVWDGECGFCHYWIIKWNLRTKDLIEYKKYQIVYNQYKDIDIEHFKNAVQLIMTDGKIYTGPAAAYKAYAMAGKFSFLIKWYENASFFKKISDLVYQKVTGNRSELYRFSKRMFGKNPRRQRYNWLIYLVLFVFILSIIIKLLSRI